MRALSPDLVPSGRASIRSAALAGALLLPTIALAQPAYDAYVIEPWDDSYSLASA